MSPAVWIQIIYFVISNAPSIVKAIRDLRDLFKASPTTGKKILKDMHEVVESPNVDNKEVSKALAEIIERYKRQA